MEIIKFIMSVPTDESAYWSIIFDPGPGRGQWKSGGRTQIS